MEFSFLFLVGILTLRVVKQVLKLHAKSRHYNLYRNFSFLWLSVSFLHIIILLQNYCFYWPLSALWVLCHSCFWYILPNQQKIDNNRNIVVIVIIAVSGISYPTNQRLITTEILLLLLLLLFLIYLTQPTKDW